MAMEIASISLLPNLVPSTGFSGLLFVVKDAIWGCSADLISLEEARDLARQYRRSARLGGDPIAERKASAGKNFSFKEAAIKVHELNVGSWKNDKHAKQWLTSLRIMLFLFLGI